MTPVEKKRWSDVKDFLHAAVYFLAFFVPLVILFFFGCICGIVRPIVGVFLRRKHGEKIIFLQGLDAMCAIDSEVDPMNVTGVLTLKGRADINRIRDIINRDVVEARNTDGHLVYPTLRRYIHGDCGYYFWLSEKNFKIEDHVRLYHGLPPKNEDQLREVLGKICTRKLESRKSPWQFIIVPLEDNFPGMTPGPRYCFVLSFLHALADGVSLVRLITSHLIEQPFNEELPIFKNRQSESLIRVIWGTLKIIFRLPRALVMQVTIHDKNALHGKPLSGIKLVGFSKPMPLQRVQRLRNLTSSSINDVLMSCVAGAMRSYFDAIGFSSPTALTAVVPVSKHDFDKDELKNSCSFVPYQLPVHVSDPLQRLSLAKLRMDDLKVSPNLWFDYYGFQFLINRVPKRVSQLYLDSLRMTCIVSNVPGSKNSYSMCGKHTLETAGFLLPNRGRVGVGISVLTYNSNVHVGVILDTAVVNRTDAVDVILTSFGKELDLLEKATATTCM